MIALFLALTSTLLLAPPVESAPSPLSERLVARIADPSVDVDAEMILQIATQLAQGTADPSTVYVVRGTDGRRNRQVTGPVTIAVDGVPAEPVDSGVFDGDGHEPLVAGEVLMILDPIADEGIVRARWVDEHGVWVMLQTVQAPPPHPTALRIGQDATQTELITDPVQTHGYQHGNTGAGGPLMPTVFEHLASFGPTAIWLNGQPFLNPFAGPTAPDWFGAIKVSDGVRDATDGTVRNNVGGFFSPMMAAAGVTDPDDLEIQCIFHDDQMPMGFPANFPSGHQFFYWLNFEDVAIQTLHFD